MVIVVRRRWVPGSIGVILIDLIPRTPDENCDDLAAAGFVATKLAGTQEIRMATKRALIVDDSRSARHILGRMLESFGLEVDAVESAELALTYLQTTRPDVIFMDHLMPGMDGFAAVRVIKGNPDTATIPVLMYTSQEGDLYLSQARALGAMGVLPKTLKHADVAEALQQLNLQTPQSAASVRPAPAARATVSPPEVLTRPGPRDPTPPEPVVSLSAEPAAAGPLSVPQLAHRIAAEVQAEMSRARSDADTGQAWRIGALATGALALVLLGVVIFQQQQIQQQLLRLQSVRPPPVVRAAPPPASVAQAEPLPEIFSGAPAAVSSASASVAEIESVAYGEVPLSGARLERLRTLVDRLHEQKVKGTVRVEAFLGDFCLTGNPVQGYTPALDELPVSRCDLIGNPFADALTVQQRQSVAFANLVASINSQPGGGIRVVLLDGARKPLTSYPAPSTSLTAAAWNRIAERNQHVEFTVLAGS